MIGAIAGDVHGSMYESYPIKTTDFDIYLEYTKFTDDTVLTIAVADSIINGIDYIQSIWKWSHQYPKAGYGATFRNWMRMEGQLPYNSWGNGSAMRVSPVGFAFNTIEEVLYDAKASAEVTHNHPEGIKGAQAVAVAVFLARNGHSKDEIKSYIKNNFNYDLSRTLEDIRPTYKFDISCQGSVPESIIAFLESYDFESAVRYAISLWGDSDTMACMAGAIAQAYYKHIEPKLIKYVRNRLTLEMIEIIDEFENTFILGK